MNVHAGSGIGRYAPCTQNRKTAQRSNENVTWPSTMIRALICRARSVQSPVYRARYMGHERDGRHDVTVGEEEKKNGGDYCRNVTFVIRGVTNKDTYYANHTVCGSLIGCLSNHTESAGRSAGKGWLL